MWDFIVQIEVTNAQAHNKDTDAPNHLNNESDQSITRISCVLCKFKFQNEQSLDKHMKYHHIRKENVRNVTSQILM